jgi:hypothetical protein
MTRLWVLGALGLALAACGVGFGSAPEGTEVFVRMQAPSEVRAGERATLTVTYEQPYPVDIEVECILKRGKKTVQTLGRNTIPAMPGGDPTDPRQTPEAGTFQLSFIPRVTGSLWLVCQTRADDNNFVARRITILPPADVRN